MIVERLHDWNVTPEAAVAIQRELAAHVDCETPLALADVRLVAGVDVSVRPGPDGQSWSQAAVVVLSFPELRAVETVRAKLPTPFPYIPGLLAFREGPALEEAFTLLQTTPDVLLFDGMGRAHPRRMGIATHMGLWLQRPTVGCGKTLLVGRCSPPDDVRGAWSALTDRGETIGAALRTRAGVQPVYISSGHRIDLASSLALVMACTGRYRLPEPIRAAHRAAGQMAFGD
jgi:deoxyribonuclease V